MATKKTARVRRTTAKGDKRWFIHDRFGLFIHWGLYALPARYEWVQHNEKIPVEDYERKYFRHFDPDLYNPKLWARTAAETGMKYFVITTKHHEGFCLWDSKLTGYKAPSAPAGRDLLGPMVAAFRAENLRVGFYHSIVDWHHPQYEIDVHHGPYRDRSDRLELNKVRDQKKYIKYLHGQVKELLTRFGPVDLIWFDGSYVHPDGSGKGREAWHSARLVELCRRLQPGILINDRLDLPCSADIHTPEETQPREWVQVDGTPVVWEACQTFNGSWGYHRDEMSWRSVDELIRILIDCVSKGGNLLLNAGPTGRGEFDERALERLRGVGEWMKRHSRSIYGCTAAPEEFTAPRNCSLTYDPQKKRLYVHVLAWPYKHLHLDGKAYADRVEYAQLLNDASEIPLGIDAWTAKKAGARDDSLVLTLPLVKPLVAVPVVELFLK